jgi:CBS domain-containing protein
MAYQLKDFELPITHAVSHIFKRPLLFVNKSDTLMTVATYLAVGPQIYVDGLVVLEMNGAVGVIGGRHTIEYILYHKHDFMKGTAYNIMTRAVFPLDAARPLNDVLDVFEKTGFAFVPIAMNQRVVTSLSARDVLRVVAREKVESPISTLSSPAVSIKKDESLGGALELMLEQNIRNVVVQYDNGNRAILNDRMIVEFLVSHVGRDILLAKGLEGLFEIEVEDLEPRKVDSVENDLSISQGAERMLDINTPCMLLDKDSIVTPWDVVMKGFERSISV